MRDKPIGKIQVSDDGGISWRNAREDEATWRGKVIVHHKPGLMIAVSVPKGHPQW